MPLLIAPLLIVLALLTVLALIPLSMVQRYRLGTSRQRARGWLTAINLTGLALSTTIFLVSAAVTTIWVPAVLTYTAAGLTVGILLGMVGLLLTRWEATIDALHYTPSRPLVLAIMLVVAARVIYGLWRAWHSWSAGIHGASWFVAAGVPGSMAAGAVVLGYYLAYWAGVRRRYRQHAGRRLRRM